MLIYLRGTLVEDDFRHVGDGEMKLWVYSNLDWAENVANNKSTLGCSFSLSLAMISFFSGNLVLLVVGPVGLAGYLHDCLIRSWIPQSFTMIIRVVSNSLRI